VNPEPSPAVPAAPPTPWARRLRTLALNLFLLFLVSVICLLLAELAARLLYPQFNPANQFRVELAPGPEAFAIGPPGRTLWHGSPKGDFLVPMQFNQYGFRDAKDVKDATPDDWFSVGDSFTMGFGVKEDERYSNLLEKKLQAAGSKARVFNIGVPGNFVDYERLVKYAEKNGAKIRHLTVGVCMDNDLADYTHPKSDWEILSQISANASFKSKIRVWVLKHSTLYITLSYLIESKPAGRKLMEKLGVAKDLVAWDAATNNTFDLHFLEVCRDELMKICNGYDAVVLIIPSRRCWLVNRDTEVKIHTTFVQLCRDAGLNVADALPVLSQDANPLGFYFEHDQHWNPRGQAVGAEVLFEAIQNRKQP
jgi:hypothetical protein